MQLSCLDFTALFRPFCRAPLSLRVFFNKNGVGVFLLKRRKENERNIILPEKTCFPGGGL